MLVIRDVDKKGHNVDKIEELVATAVWREGISKGLVKLQPSTECFRESHVCALQRDPHRSEVGLPISTDVVRAPREDTPRTICKASLCVG